MSVSTTRTEDEGSEGWDGHEVVEMDDINPSEHATDPHTALIGLQAIGRPPRSSRRPRSFDAAAIMQWRSQGIALPMSPSRESSPTLVASTYSPSRLSVGSWMSTTQNTAHKRQSSVSKLWRHRTHSPRPSRAWRVHPLHIAACVLTILLLSWYLLGGTHISFWQSNLVESLNLDCADPYTAPGRLDHSDRWPDATRWLPYDPSCFPPPLLATLRAGLESKPSQYSEPAELQFPLKRTSTSAGILLPLPWLVGKTVVLVGDDVERAHAKDFCRFADGEYTVVTSNHPLSPRPFANGIDEKWVQNTQGSLNETRPTVCYLPRYDFVLVNVFHFGLANRVEFEHESIFRDPHFYPPAALRDRLDSILLPILSKLGRTSPDLVEFASGFWDLRHFAAVDGRYGQPLDRELSPDRLEWYTDRLVQAFSDLGALFPRAKLFWRPVYTITTADWAAPTRSIALERLASRIVTALNTSPDAVAVKADLLRAISSRTKGKDSQRSAIQARGLDSVTTHFLNRMHERIGSKERLEVTAPASWTRASLQGRLEVDPWNSVVRGQEPLDTNPGGYVWSDIMLYNLWKLTLDKPRWRKP